MRELTLTEINEINGGAFWGTVGSSIGALGLAYAFDGMGGFHGINALAKQFGTNFYSWAGDFYSTYGMSNK